MSDSSIWSLVAAVRAEAIQVRRLNTASAPVREGEVFAYLLERVPVGIPTGSALAGEFGWEYCTPADRARWTRAEPAPAPAPTPSAPSPLELVAARFHCHGSDGGSAHTTVDYGRVIAEGLGGILAEIDAGLADATGAKREYLLGMRAALVGVIRWAERYALLADALAAETQDQDERARMEQIARHCRRVPSLPARTFAEALQSVWLIHLAVGLSEGSGSSLSLGRLDQYLLPLFMGDLDRGIPLGQLEDQLEEFFRALNSFFGDAACTVNLGGSDEHGQTLFNALSRTIVEVAARLRLPAPILAARIDDGLPEDAFDLYTDPALFAIGQPTFYGEEPCKAALIRRGVPADEVHGSAANSCMGLVMPGQEWSNMWGTVVNLLLPLELALNGGRPFAHALPLSLATQAPDAYGDFDALFATVCGYTRELVDLFIKQTERDTQRRGAERPNPLVSALLADCVARGKDRLLGGCRYQSVIVEAFGLVNVSDALVAIRELVFDRGIYSLEELVRAARDNFEGHDTILRNILGAPKYGNGDPRADEMARRLAEEYADAVSRHSHDGLYYLPSFHTLTAHVPAGAKTAASLDGRRAGEPLAKNIGTSPGRATCGHTALMRSAATIDQSAYSGGQALDIRVAPGLLATVEGRHGFQALLRTYFRMGGLQVQVNGLSADELRAARVEPELHRDLIVRIAGYSAPYVSLPPEVQVEMIARFEAGL
ncbi:MAG: hypothetical protein HPY44_21655 [Armatimonadetes bacterium]|nr:hypothetical protein [Armatimonadota bacterium]